MKGVGTEQHKESNLEKHDGISPKRKSKDALLDFRKLRI
jgi:hypothetical protein